MSRLGMVALAGLLAGCGTRTVSTPASGAQEAETAASAEATAGRPEPSAEASPPAMSEAAARALLSERFRAAGLRVLYDVTLDDDAAFAVTLDGFDPDRRIGFEYVDPAERDVDLSPAERQALMLRSDVRVLVVDAATAEQVAERAERFLAETRE